VVAVFEVPVYICTTMDVGVGSPLDQANVVGFTSHFLAMHSVLVIEA